MKLIDLREPFIVYSANVLTCRSCAAGVLRLLVAGLVPDRFQEITIVESFIFLLIHINKLIRWHLTYNM